MARMTFQPPSRIWKGLLFGAAVLALLLYFLSRPLPAPSFEVTSFNGQPERYSREKKGWIPISLGDTVGTGEKIRTPYQSEVDLKIPDEIRMRLKEDSELEVGGRSIFDPKATYRVRLRKGDLLASTEKDFEKERGFEVATSGLVASFRTALGRIHADPVKKNFWAGVLQGELEVRPVSEQLQLLAAGQI